MTAKQELLRREPQRPAEPIVTALRGSAPEGPYVPPDAREILRLGLYDVWDLRPRELFVSELKAHDPVLRFMSAEVLGSIGDSSTTPALIEALDDRNQRVRRAATEALAKVGGAAAVEPLQRLAADPRAGARLRWRARRAIRAIRARETAE
jgi:HEAT repeat protein